MLSRLRKLKKEEILHLDIKAHKVLNLISLYLVIFSVFVPKWQKKAFRGRLNVKIYQKNPR